MSQKEKIVSLLRVNGIMTQGELAEAIYGDKLHTPNIYSALMSLVGSNRVIRSGAHPARYSLRDIYISEQKETKGTCLLGLEDTEVLQPKQNDRPSQCLRNVLSVLYRIILMKP